MSTIPQRRSRTQEYDLEEDDAYYTQRPHTSAVLGSYTLSWWQNHQLDSTYGMPRTYQTDQVVGHADSTGHPTHFIAVNLNAHITIIEIPGGDSSHARIYSGPTLLTDNGDTIPVTLEFYDVNGDGKVDMIVHIGDQKIVYLNDGTQFKLQQ
jgi:hypothetical protein